jgi:hypothetical protein
MSDSYNSQGLRWNKSMNAVKLYFAGVQTAK